MKLSIIVPVYNVEKYLAKCLDSIFAQDVEADRMEVIVVDDCSTDDSLRVARDYAAAHPGLRVFDSPANGGPGRARNRGIEEAHGDYLLFVDSDDTLVPGVLVGMLAEMEREELDMMAFGYRGVDAGGHPIAWGPGNPRIADPGTLTGEEYLLANPYLAMIPTYLFRRAFLEEHRLRMIPGRLHEDEEFVPRALCLCRRVRYYPVTAYNYLCREGSIMTAWTRRNIEDLIVCLGSLNRFLGSGAVRDRRVVANLRFRMSVQLYRAMRESLRIDGITPRQAHELMKAEGVLPLANPHGHLNRWLINHSLRGFVFYNTRLRRR